MLDGRYAWEVTDDFDRNLDRFINNINDAEAIANRRLDILSGVIAAMAAQATA